MTDISINIGKLYQMKSKQGFVKTMNERHEYIIGIPSCRPLESGMNGERFHRFAC